MTSSPSISSAINTVTLASLAALPAELLVHIFESVPSDYHQQCRNFAAIARVNHTYHSIITPLLYRNFKDCCTRHLKLFGRTILSNQSYAELVKHYEGRHHTRHSSSSICPSVWTVFALDGELEEDIVKRRPSLLLPITPSVFSDAITSFLPNLQRLDVTNGGNMLMKQLSGSYQHTATPFQQLQSLHVATEPDRTYEMYDLALLFMLPSLTALTIDLAVLNTAEEQMSAPIETLWRCRPRSATVRELTLERCGLPAPWVSAMIASCKTLKQFYDEHYYWGNMTDYYPQIFHSLMAHHQTLSCLRVSEINGCKLDVASQSEPLEPLSLEHFISLTHADVPLFSFASRTHHPSVDRLLPSGLQVLTLDVRSTREGSSDNFFILLAEAAPNHLPRLKSVEVICRIEEYREEGYLPLHFCHLRRMFANVGIELSYFLEFVQCEFKAAYMAKLLANMRASGPDGVEMADHSSHEIGCLSQSYSNMSCNSRSPNANRSKHNWGYMQAWTGPSEYELLT